VFSGEATTSAQDAKVLFEGRRCRVADRRLRDRFPPYARHVYEIE